jgi:hypothetical protein
MSVSLARPSREVKDLQNKIIRNKGKKQYILLANVQTIQCQDTDFCYISAITLPLHIEEIDEKDRDIFYNA